MLELAISWLTSQPFVASVIAGARRPEQIRANAAAACWDLTPQDFAAIASIVA
jgi:aryl-alcohol dehydrogenase-like predicted oxidoreductase